MNRRMLLLTASVSCWASLTVPASAQQFESIPGLLTQVAAGRAEVWGINSAQKVLRYNVPNNKFAQVAGTPTQVAVGGGSLLKSDAGGGAAHRAKYSNSTSAPRNWSRLPVHSPRLLSAMVIPTAAIPTKCGESTAAESIGTTIAPPCSTIAPAGVIFGGSIPTPTSSNTTSRCRDGLKLEAVCGKSRWESTTRGDWMAAGHAYRYDHSAGFVQVDGSAVFTQIAVGGNGV